MKQLTLRITSFHRLTPDQVATKVFDRVGGVIGRSAEADWVLPDPEKIVSSTHAVITFEAGSYSITDYSTNGLFINRSVEALGKGQTRMLQDGDYLQIGEYEIEVAVEDHQVTQTEATNTDSYSSPIINSGGQPDPRSQMAEDYTSAVTGTIEPQAFQAADFDQQPANGNPLDESYSAPPLKQTQATQPIPDDWNPEVNHSVQQPQIATVTAESAVAPQINAPKAEIEAGYLQQAPANMTPQPSIHTQTHAQSEMNGSQSAMPENPQSTEVCLAELMRGLGLNTAEIQLANQPEFYHRLGAALRLSLQGMLDILRARASMKSEFRVMQTTIRTQENNPLKFSINVDEAIRNLFARRIPGFLSWDQAIQECFKDMSSHELALMAGTEGAVNAVLAQLNPEHFTSDEQQGRSLEKWIPVAKKAKSWDKYQEQYKKVNEELGHGSAKRFSEEFAEAYEAQLTALGVR